MSSQNQDQFLTTGSEAVDLAALSVIGDRREQQDCFGYAFENNGAFVVLCDGMGGHQGGCQASRVTVEHMLGAYRDPAFLRNISSALHSATVCAGGLVHGLMDNNGVPLNAGSTLVAVVVADMRMYWNSVGDSRAYLLRRGEFVQFTQDQNYRTVLDERLQAGEISQDAYRQELTRGDALISYLGMENLQLIDYNAVPLMLRHGDRIILMSDGLYKLLSDEEIARVLDNFRDVGEALQALELKARKNARKSGDFRDNMTVVLMEIK